MTKQELAAKIWATANVLRKNIKASEYKDYILGFMFYKYLSDQEVNYIKDLGGTREDLQNVTNENIRLLRDRLGYFIAYDDLFSSWQTLGKKLGAQIVTEAIDRFYQSLNKQSARVFYVYHLEVDHHSGVFNALDAGLSKLGENLGSRDKAVRDIIDLVAQIPTQSRSYDVLGYIYEYLIREFSSEAKKDGAFYTPHELTSLMARIITDHLKDRKPEEYIQVYDPCVGTAGLLLNIGTEIGKYHDKDHIRYYGQELITETSNLAKMNLFMKEISYENLIIRNPDTLDEDWPIDPENHCGPLYVDAVTANPPYSAHWDPELHTSDERFRQYGLAPSTKADLAFLLHCLYHIKPDGIVAIVLPHGVLFRGGAEEEIRKNLIENNNIETIIGLPSNLFFSTGIPVIVMILSKNRAASDVLFIDASQSFQKDKTQNVLQESDVQRIYDAVIARRDIPHFARLVSKEQIVAEGYNLNIPRYISATQEEAPYDLYALMTGEIAGDELDSFADFWQQFPQLRSKLFTADGSYNRFITEDIAGVVHADEGVASFQLDFQKQCQVFHTYLTHTLVDSPTDERTHDKIAANRHSSTSTTSIRRSPTTGGISMPTSRISATKVGKSAVRLSLTSSSRRMPKQSDLKKSWSACAAKSSPWASSREPTSPKTSPRSKSYCARPTMPPQPLRTSSRTSPKTQKTPLSRMMTTRNTSLRSSKPPSSHQSTSPPMTSLHSGSCCTRSTPRKPTRKRLRPPTPHSRKRPKPRRSPSPIQKSTTCSKRPGSPP